MRFRTLTEEEEADLARLGPSRPGLQLLWLLGSMGLLVLVAVVWYFLVDQLLLERIVSREYRRMP